MEKDKVKKLVFTLIITITVISIIGISIALILGSRVTPNKAEVLVKDAAMKYIEENPKDAPSVGEFKNIDDKFLSNKKYMKPMEKMIKKDYNCSANVQIENDGNNYKFFVDLDCGKSYKTAYFSDQIKSNLNLEFNKSGLYEIDNEFIFKGESPKNYVSILNELWRIIKIDETGKIHLIKEGSLNPASSWDDRYNKDVGTNGGIKDYEFSRLREYTEKYNNSFVNQKQNISHLLTTEDVCVEPINKNLKKEPKCNKKLENINISNLGVYDYLNASLDTKCKNILTLECSNYNYINDGTSFYTRDITSGKGNLVYLISGGEVRTGEAKFKYSVRPVIYLNAKTPATLAGIGTELDPFIVE